jgi:hypothetical protein
MKIYRRIVFTGSVLVSASLYAFLYIFAPSILLLRSADAAHTSLPKPLRIMLYNGPMPESRPPEARGTQTLASRPGSVRDLLKEETKELPLAAPVAPPASASPPMAEVLAREYDLSRDDALLGGIEAQLVAIPEQSARAGIEVARRLVSDNDKRLIAKDEMPALTDGSGLPATFALPAAQASIAPAAALDALRPLPQTETPTMSLLNPPADRPSPAVPGLSDETVLARKALVEEVRSGTPFAAMEGLVRIEASTYVDPSSREGYFRLRIIPRDDAKIPPLPRDVTFVVDASNSIVQRKLDLTVRGIAGCLAMLRPEDRFNIVVFRDTPKSFRASPVPADPATIAEARKFMEGLKSSGSTDVYGAVEPVLAEPPRAGGPGLVMVISDGRPTTGNLEGRDLIRGLSEQNRAGNTVYTFGGGNTVNRYLMDLLAYRNRGESRIAERIEDVDDELPKFFRRVQDAILVNLQADYGRVDESDVFPQALPDFYRGRVVTVYGRYRPGKDNDLVLRLQGRAGEERKEIVLKTDLANAEKGGRDVAEGWAFQKTYHLIGEITEAGETPEIMDEIRRLSNEFGVKTSYSP